MNPRYEIRETIGQGGLGSVHRAYDTQLQRDVAMKRVLTTGQGTPEEVHAAGEKLIAEAQTLSTLNHPNIVTVFDVGQDEDGGFVVMELLKGETLDETVERGVLTSDDFREVVYQTMEGLVAAQDKDVIHRDIKPTNIMLIWQASGRFQLKILDFGLAKFSKSPSVQTMDQDEAVMGSIFFMAPEQFERAELDARTDLYQMGCVYYNALTGQYPFNGETAPQVMNAHLQHKVVPIDQLRPDLPPTVAQWVMWLINRDIESRPTNAKEALKYFPKESEALPAQVVIEDTMPVATVPGTPTIKIATPGANASAPPNLIVSPRTTGHFASGSNPPAIATAQPAVAKATPVLATATPAVATAAPAVATATVVEEVEETGIDDSTATGQAPRKKGLSATMVVSIVGVLAIAATAGLIAIKKGGDAKKAARLAAFQSENPPSPTIKDVGLLVGFMTDSKKRNDIVRRKEAYQTLKVIKGSGIDAAILDELRKAPTSGDQKNLATIISERGYSEAFPVLVGLSKTSRKTEDKASYLRMAKPLASPANIEEVLKGLKETENLGIRKEYEDTLVTILYRDKNAEATLSRLRQRVKTASGGERRSLFRVLGLMGGDKTRRVLDKIFEGDDPALQADAVSAYFSWPNRDPLPKVASMIGTVAPTVKRPALRAYGLLSGKPGAIKIGQYIADWQKGVELMKDEPTEVAKMIQRIIVETPHPRTVGMLEGWQEHPRYGKLAKAQADAMKQSLTRLPTLEAEKELKGTMARVQGNDAGSNSFLEALTAWTSPETYFSWSFKAKTGGDYSLSVLQADLSETPSEFVVYLDGKAFKGKSSKTETLEEFKPVNLEGKITLLKGEVYKLTLVAGENIQPRMMDIKAVVLKK